jgi:hypothetical protein
VVRQGLATGPSVAIQQLFQWGPSRWRIWILQWHALVSYILLVCYASVYMMGPAQALTGAGPLIRPSPPWLWVYFARHMCGLQWHTFVIMMGIRVIYVARALHGPAQALTGADPWTTVCTLYSPPMPWESCFHGPCNGIDTMLVRHAFWPPIQCICHVVVIWTCRLRRLKSCTYWRKQWQVLSGNVIAFASLMPLGRGASAQAHTGAETPHRWCATFLLAPPRCTCTPTPNSVTAPARRTRPEGSLVFPPGPPAFGQNTTMPHRWRSCHYPAPDQTYQERRGPPTLCARYRRRYATATSHSLRQSPPQMSPPSRQHRIAPLASGTRTPAPRAGYAP